MWNLFKKLFKHAGALEAEPPTSIQKLVSFNALNKRKNIRIQFPRDRRRLGGPFPQVSYKGSEVIAGNISVGGLLVIDEIGAFGSEVGEVVEIEMQWHDAQVKMRSRIVGAHGDRRHLQFVDFSAPLFLRVSQMIKPCYLGGRFHRVKDPGGQLHADELWIGPTKESLTFTKSDGHSATHETFAELVWNGETIMFQRGAVPTAIKNGHALSTQSLNEVLVLLSNFPDISLRVQELIEAVGEIAELRVLRKAG